MKGMTKKMLTIVKATELDGVTLKDADTGEKFERSNVDKRFGLAVYNLPEQIVVGSNLVAYDPSVKEHERRYLRTSSIKGINHNPITNQIEVTTKNTIYFIEEAPEENRES
jgi:hypothetical protein